MISYSDNQDVVFPALQPLIDGYGMRLLEINHSRLWLASPRCEVRLFQEPRERDFFAHLTRPGDPQGRIYTPPFLIALDPFKFKWTNRQYDANISARENLAEDLRLFAKNLIDVFPDILLGDFDKYDQAGYWSINDFLSRHIVTVLSLPPADPARQKLERGDMTWVNDIKLRGYT